jgi:hypothetical protein
VGGRKSRERAGVFGHSGRPAQQNLAMESKAVAAGLFAAWTIHDLEEILGTRYWRGRAIPRLRARYPNLPEAVWRTAEIETVQMVIAVSLVGVPVAVASMRGARTGGRSPLFQAAVTAYGLHGVGHVAGSLLARDYTPGVLTSPLIVVPYALWARHRLQRIGVWQSLSGRDVALSLLAVAPLVAGAQGLARLLTSRRR